MKFGKCFKASSATSLSEISLSIQVKTNFFKKLSQDMPKIIVRIDFLRQCTQKAVQREARDDPVLEISK